MHLNISYIADVNKKTTYSGQRDKGRHLVESAYQKIVFSFLNQNIYCGHSKEPSQSDGSFEHPKHMLKGMGKEIFTILL